MDARKKGESLFYSFKDKTIEGKTVEFSRFIGKTCIIVNTACKCGLAEKGFKAIREIKQEYPQIEILLFPSRLGAVVDQELETPEEIIKRMKEKGVYEISTVFEKRQLDSSKGLFKWLISEGGKKSSIFDIFRKIKWNFTTFIITEEGEVASRIGPTDISFEKIKDVLISLHLVKSADN